MWWPLETAGRVSRVRPSRGGSLLLVVGIVNVQVETAAHLEYHGFEQQRTGRQLSDDAVFTLVLETCEAKQVYYCWSISTLRATLQFTQQSLLGEIRVLFKRPVLTRWDTHSFYLFLTHLQVGNAITVELLSSLKE